ncbi:MAG TPA: alpha/beta fold hydrolase [Stellaceae bacterium]|nr:alpha/beta fold hydrolase [Stellaceae bacterium]
MDAEAFTSKQARLGGAEISYLERGAGQALVLLHGIGSGARSWRNQLAALSDHFRVIAWDAPGYGRSTPLAKSAPDAADYAAALAAFLAALGVARCHLVGHSLGALIAARFAAERPGLILSLTLASVARGHAHLPAEERERLLQGRLADVASLGSRGMAEKRGPRLLGPDATAAMRQSVIETMAAVDPPGYGQAARMLSQGDAKADVARLPAAMPVQFVWADADVITTPAANRAIAAARPQAPVQIIASAGHALYLEKPDEFNAILRRFVVSLGAA